MKNLVMVLVLGISAIGWAYVYLATQNPTVATSGALLLGVLVGYVFWPEQDVAAQNAKTRLEYLRERQDALYDNLRDLNFEYNSGKYPGEDYAAQRATLENEAAEVLAEIDLLESGLYSSHGAAVQH